MKEIILLGDSIRMYYQESVKKLLGEDYNISAPNENCMFTAYTLIKLREWLDSFPKPDIIHWNNGLWDTSVRYQEDGCFTPIEEYIANLKKILRELKKTGAKIIFATITPVDPKKAVLSENIVSTHQNVDIDRYNKAALEIMKEENVTINDLNSVVQGHISEYIRQDDLIHPTELGVEALSKAVANAIRNII